MSNAVGYQWNKTAWFSAAFGCTLFMFFSGIDILTTSKAFGCFVLTVTVAASVLGLSFYIWAFRRYVEPIVAAQILIWVTFVAAIATFALRELASAGNYTVTGIWWVLFLLPILMLRGLFRSPRPAGKSELLRRFSTKDWMVSTQYVSRDSERFHIASLTPQTIPLFEITDLRVGHCILVLRAQARAENITRGARLEVACRANGVIDPAAVSQGPVLEGSGDWVGYEVHYFLRPQDAPDTILINAAFDGKGVLWVKDLELHQTPLTNG